MTAIVGLVQDGEVWMGADSAGVYPSYEMTITKHPKVFRVGGMLIGFTSSWRMGQILQYGLPGFQALDSVIHEPYAQADAFVTVCTTFIEWCRDVFKAAGYATKEKYAEIGGQFLVGYRGRLFKVESDYSVGEAAIGFDAIGCGALPALGSLYTSRLSGGPEYRIEKALMAAEKFSAGVRSPFTILKLEKAA